MMTFSEELLKLADEAEQALAAEFARIDRISHENTARVMRAFAEHRVDAACFAPTTGYGYDDRGREVLDRIFADVMGAEAAFVRHNIVNGTHALTIGLFGLLRTGDTMLSLTGKPYDTLEEVIGIAGTPGNGSLADYGVRYHGIEMLEGLKSFSYFENGGEVFNSLSAVADKIPNFNIGSVNFGLTPSGSFSILLRLWFRRE